jgi:hypothetical protein
MSLFLVLVVLFWASLGLTLFATVRMAGLCSAAEERQADKRLFEKWQQDSDQAARLVSAGNQP